MAPMNWNDKAERDLLLAIVIQHLTTVNSSGDVVSNINWAPVHEMFKEFGYHDAARGAISQRFTKSILKGYKESSKSAGSSNVVASPPKAAATKRKAQATTKDTKNAKRAKKTTEATKNPEDSEDAKDGLEDGTV